MCVLGSTVVVLHSPKEQEVESIEDLLEKVRDPGKTAVGSSRNSIASCAFKCLYLLATKRDVTRRTICCVDLLAFICIKHIITVQVNILICISHAKLTHRAKDVREIFFCSRTELPLLTSGSKLIS